MLKLNIKLINCPACGREISSQAISCPHCGQPIASNVSMAKTQNESSVEAINQNAGVILAVLSFLSLAAATILPVILCAPAAIIAGQQSYKKGCKAGRGGMIGGIILCVVYVLACFLAAVAGNRD